MKCEDWCWASPLSEWCTGKHNIGRYGGVFHGGVMALWQYYCVLLYITVILLHITVIHADSQAGQNGGGHWPNDSP